MLSIHSGTKPEVKLRKIWEVPKCFNLNNRFFKVEEEIIRDIREYF